jgi:hypothetical protein
MSRMKKWIEWIVSVEVFRPVENGLSPGREGASPALRLFQLQDLLQHDPSESDGCVLPV